MTDEAHVQTKANQSLSESDAISVILIRNPESSPVSNYRTAIDPALVLSRPAPLDQKVIELDDSVSPAWFSKYGTGVSEAEIFHKRSILANGLQQIAVGDGPWISDVGASVDLIDGADPTSLIDDWHKTIVTDLTDDDIEIVSAAQSGSYYMPLGSLYTSQNMLFPVSSRHIVKTSDGVLHAVTAYIVSGISRVFYLRSGNGGRTWTSTIVDPDDGMSYVFPAITCDKYDGIHITFTRYDPFIYYTYWLYSGNDVPTGYTLLSDPASGDVFGNRLLFGGKGLYYDGDVHDHGYTVSDGGSTSCQYIRNDESNGTARWCGWHHTTFSHSISEESHIPPYKTLRVLRYPGLPYYLPAGVILPFDQIVPSGYTRYSAQDGLHIRGSSSVGTTGGATQHRHLITGNVSGDYGAYNVTARTGSGGFVNSSHSHTFIVYTGYANNDVPAYGVVLGQLDALSYTIPQHSLILSNSDPSLSFLTLLSGVGGALADKSLVGAASYGLVSAGSTTHGHSSIANAESSDRSGGSCYFDIEDFEMVYVAKCSHKHRFDFVFDPANSLPARVCPYISHLDSDIDCGTRGSDLFYVYILPTGSVSAAVNISQMYSYFPSIEASVLADDSDNVHVLYSCQGLNTNPGRARICYKKKSSGTWGSRTDITTSDNHMLYPSMDIDVAGDIHTAWFNATTYQAIQYCKYSAGAWGAIEDVDTSSYVGMPSNIITDKDCNVFLFYAYWTDAGTAIKEVLYRKRTSGGWSAAVNLTPGKAAAGYNQFPGQSLLDNKGNVIVTFSGKGYGAHTAVYHPVYRYIKVDGTVVPSTANDAVDFFPDDDNEIIYPTVFWHSYPLTDDVYQNLVISGFTFLYLYNPRNGASKDTADLRFYSSPNALVGDVGAVGSGGSGEGDFVPSGVSAEGIFQHETFTINNRGHLNFPHIRSIGIGKSVF